MLTILETVHSVTSSSWIVKKQKPDLEGQFCTSSGDSLAKMLLGINQFKVDLKSIDLLGACYCLPWYFASS